MTKEKTHRNGKRKNALEWQSIKMSCRIMGGMAKEGEFSMI